MAKETIGKRVGIIIPIIIIAMILMFFISIPTPLLDTFQALNITIGITILLLSMNISRALDLSIFPSLLLVTTLFRLVLNVSSTKLILLQGISFNGRIIRTFGDFVVGGNYVVGVILFLILIIIQFIVITKGSERVAEVAARFTLDAMPGKQMSIDADYNSGLITEDEARQRRKDIQREADFYGSMDGASKFVKGDVIAGLIITVINIIGGLVIGVFMRGETAADAARVYTLLTIGDGLASQIPALLISVATGVIVTRTASEDNFGTDLVTQFLQEPKILYMVSVSIFVLALIPGMPKLPFFVISIGLSLLGYFMSREITDVTKGAEIAKEEAKAKEEIGTRPEEIKELLKVDELELEIGYSLIPLVDMSQGGDLLERITMIRKQIALDLGLIVPPIRIRDNMQLNPNEYEIRIKGAKVSSGDIMIDNFLAMAPGDVEEEITGIPTVEPAFGLPAIWIPEEKREKAELVGYTVVDPTSVLATHLTETIKRYGQEILTREMVKEIIDNVKEDYSVVVEEVYPKKFDLGDIQTVLQNLLIEGVSIRNMPLILETIADASKITTNIDMLSEYVRSGLSRQICNDLVSPIDKKLRVITMDPNIEENLKESLKETEFGSFLSLSPEDNDNLLRILSREVENSNNRGFQPVFIVSPDIRKPLKRLIERNLKGVCILSYNEIIEEVELEAIGMVNNA